MDLGQALGASSAATLQKFSIYLPDRDQFGNPVGDIDLWVEGALELMTTINGGATLLPPAIGMWKPEGGETVRENTSVVISFIRNADGFEQNLKLIANFLHKFGKRTGQGEVMVEISGESEFRDTPSSELQYRYTSRAYFIDRYVHVA